MKVFNSMKLGVIALATVGMIAACGGGSSSGSSTVSASKIAAKSCPAGLELVLKHHLSDANKKKLAAGLNIHQGHAQSNYETIIDPVMFPEENALYKKAILDDGTEVFRAVTLVSMFMKAPGDDVYSGMYGESLVFVYVDEDGSVTDKVPAFEPFRLWNESDDDEVMPVWSYNLYNSLDLATLPDDQFIINQNIKTYYNDLFVNWGEITNKYAHVIALIDGDDSDIMSSRIDTLIPGDFRADLQKVKRAAERWHIAMNFLVDDTTEVIVNRDSTVLDEAVDDLGGQGIAEEVNEILVLINWLEVALTSLSDGVLNLKDMGVNDTCMALVMDTVSLDGEVGSQVGKIDLSGNKLSKEGLRSVLEHLDKRDNDGNRIHGLGISSIVISDNMISEQDLEDLKAEFSDLLGGILFTDIELIMDPTIGDIYSILGEEEDSSLDGSSIDEEVQTIDDGHEYVM